MLKLDDMAVNLSYCQLQEVLMPEMKSFRVFALSCIATFSLELAENPLKFCKNSQLWTRLSIGQCFVAGGPQLSLLLHWQLKRFLLNYKGIFSRPVMWSETEQWKYNNRPSDVLLCKKNGHYNVYMRKEIAFFLIKSWIVMVMLCLGDKLRMSFSFYYLRPEQISEEKWSNN